MIHLNNKTLDLIFRIFILLSAGVTVISRYVLFKGTGTLSENVLNTLNIMSYVGVGVLAVCGIIYAICLKINHK